MFAFILLSALLCSASVVDAVLLPRQTKPSKFLFIFGDSYSMTGFSISNTPQPSLSNPFGNPSYPGSRISGGDIWVDILMSNNSRPSTVVYDFAVGGNPVNGSRVQPTVPLPSPISDLSGQMAAFQSGVGGSSSNKIGWTGSNSLFVCFFGVNDVALQAYAGRNVSAGQAILQPDVGDYFGILGKQYALGVRKFMLILVPPISRAPVFGYGNATVASDSPTVATLTSYFNAQVKSQASAFRSRYRAASVTIVDPTATFNTILDNPTQYGAPNSTCLSYPAGAPCLWHDFIHPGVVMQRQLGTLISNGMKGIGF